MDDVSGLGCDDFSCAMFVTLQGSPWVPYFQDNFGDTALHMAARSNSLAIVKELLEPRGIATTRS